MTKVAPLSSPYFVALDIDDKAQALELAQQLAPVVGGFKVGPRLALRYGAELIQKLSALAPVFLDIKFYDIPSTMESSVQAAFDMGASFCTIHAGCGKQSLENLVQLESQLQKERPFKILAVTILTSYDETHWPSHWARGTTMELVLKLTQEVSEAGLSGIVCSPFEAAAVKAHNKKLFVVTPGVRLQPGSDDQKRVMIPADALAEGADALVIGRPIVRATDPLSVATELSKTLIKS